MEINCEKCNNQGFVFKEFLDKEGNVYKMAIDCDCLSKRKYVAAARHVGLGDDIFNKTFDTFETSEVWQEVVKNKAIEFCCQNKAKAFYIGGQVGSGKTHICTAIINQLIKQGKQCHYVIWNDIVTRLKQLTYEDEAKYHDYLNQLKFAEVLFIDDFFKNSISSKADIDKAFQIINMRYINAKTQPIITLISSEKTIQELMDIDEAIASRIYELTNSGEYSIEIMKDKAKNYRLKNIG